MSQKPFIIRQHRTYLVPPDSQQFNVIIEKRVQFVQGANTFVAAMLAYDSITHIYNYFYYADKCITYAYLIFVLILGNAFWIFCSLYGFTSIDSKDSQKIHRYYILLLFVLLTRIIVYGAMGYILKQYQSQSSIVCESLTSQGLLLIQISIESVLLVILIIFSRSIRKYVRIWEQNEYQKNWGS